MRTHLQLFLVMVVLAWAAPAAAQPGVGKRGAVVFSVDRLFGASISRTTFEGGNGTPEVTDSRTDIGLLVSAPTNIYAQPRLAVDFAIRDELTLGGALGLAINNGETKAELGGASNTEDLPSQTLFLLAPRIGWARDLGPVAALWLRGGLTVFRLSQEVSDELSADASGLSLNLEPTVVFSLATHFGLSAGLILDFPLVGEAELRNEGPGGGAAMVVERDIGIRNLGVAFGFFGRL